MSNITEALSTAQGLVNLLEDTEKEYDNEIADLEKQIEDLIDELEEAKDKIKELNAEIYELHSNE